MLVQLTKFWITNVVTEESLGRYSAPDRPRSSSVQGEVRRYAGGRMRAVGTLGTAAQWQVTLMELTLADTELLELWMSQGVTVFARDHRGASMYGTFFQVDIDELRAVTYPLAVYTATIQIQRVDVVEGE